MMIAYGNRVRNVTRISKVERKLVLFMIAVKFGVLKPMRRPN